MLLGESSLLQVYAMMQMTAMVMTAVPLKLMRMLVLMLIRNDTIHTNKCMIRKMTVTVALVVAMCSFVNMLHLCSVLQEVFDGDACCQN